jgi:hypothetical protein
MIDVIRRIAAEAGGDDASAEKFNAMTIVAGTVVVEISHARAPSGSVRQSRPRSRCGHGHEWSSSANKDLNCRMGSSGRAATSRRRHARAPMRFVVACDRTREVALGVLIGAIPGLGPTV